MDATVQTGNLITKSIGTKENGYSSCAFELNMNTDFNLIEGKCKFLSAIVFHTIILITCIIQIIQQTSNSIWFDLIIHF